ncbi:putative late blight resistance protein homolog R1B-17 [Salvia miltiorrhiza]|uniref:putative late blight resistance protein homolog R1B-17 n=1 Tax=Salvia miltiorrhiza TaxID=226208 RepID=UPI0025AC77E1|nr:putative late blight resistance protein homolog R1B-17 [Salvia miltiorrhiza]
MAAYAALVSLMHTIDDIKAHPSPPISLPNQQVQSLTEKLNFMLGFLEGCNIQLDDEQTSCTHFHQHLQKVIEEMDLIKTKAEKKAAVEAHELHRNISDHRGRVGSISRKRKSPMVGLDDVLPQLMDKLVGGDPNRQIVPIVGMAGIVSQNYNVGEALGEIISQVGEERGENGGELGEELHKYLFGRRYLVVMDDMWSIEAWDRMKVFFPYDGNGSRILVTTRLSNLAAHLSKSNTLDMRKTW